MKFIPRDNIDAYRTCSEECSVFSIEYSGVMYVISPDKNSQHTGTVNIVHPTTTPTTTTGTGGITPSKLHTKFISANTSSRHFFVGQCMCTYIAVGGVTIAFAVLVLLLISPTFALAIWIYSKIYTLNTFQIRLIVFLF